MTLLTPEQKARAQIDAMLARAGWVVQPRHAINRFAATGVAVCEFPLTTGEADTMLFADGRPIGVIEAKPAGTTLSGVEPQASQYCEGLPELLRPLAWHDPLPFRQMQVSPFVCIGLKQAGSQVMTWSSKREDRSHAKA